MLSGKAAHERMVNLRAQKVAGIANDIPEAECDPPNGDVLVLGWGSTRGAITGAVNRLRAKGEEVSACFLRHVNPLPRNLGDLMKGFRKVIIPEMNLGQLALLVRARYLVDAESFTKVQGRPFSSEEIEARVIQALEELTKA